MKVVNFHDPLTGPPCGCAECIEADVATEQTRRDPDTGAMLHGWALRRGIDAFKAFQVAARAAVGPSRRRGGVFERLAREPGSDDE